MSRNQGFRITTRIAKTELSALFGSPIAWFILIVFSVLTSVSFMNLFSSQLNFAQLYPDFRQGQTMALFLGNFGFFSKIVNNLYIYVPLLTMGLISREVSSGSIKLAYSSPVTSFQLVMGKFMAALVMGLCLMAVPAVAVAGGAIFIEHFDILPVLVAMCGLYLQICAYCAIGLFMSSLTSYQVVAAVCTLATLAILGRIGRFGREYEFVQNIVRWLSINGRTGYFLDGVFRTDDFFYFIALIILFSGLTVFRVSFPRRNLPAFRKVASYLCLFAVVFGIAALSSRPSLIGIKDTTRNRSNSLSEGSKAVLAGMEGKIVINTYYNLLDNGSYRYLASTQIQKSLFEQVKLSKPDIEEHSIYYYADCPGSLLTNPKHADKTLEEARDYMCVMYNLNPRVFKSPEEMASASTVREENGLFVRELIGPDGRKSLLRNFSDTVSEPTETEIMAAISKLFCDQPVVLFSAGNGERDIMDSESRGFSSFSVARSFRYALMNQGFDVARSSFDEPIPEEVTMLVVADPSEPFSAAQLDVFRAYLDRGGNLMIHADYANRKVVAPLLAELGLCTSDRQLAAREGDLSASLILARECASAADGLGGIASGENRVTMSGAVALDTLAGPCAFERVPFLSTSPEAWLEKDYAGFRDDVVSCDPSSGEAAGTYDVAYALTRETGGRQQRIIVFGDADCFSNAELTISREGVESDNFNLIQKCFRWISNGRFPIEIVREPSIDTDYRITQDALPFVKAFYLYIFPLLVLAAALMVLGRRRRG